jgi:hypothetical protein
MALSMADGRRLWQGGHQARAGTALQVCFYTPGGIMLEGDRRPLEREE